jgi:hypothetical protein
MGGADAAESVCTGIPIGLGTLPPHRAVYPWNSVITEPWEGAVKSLFTFGHEPGHLPFDTALPRFRLIIAADRLGLPPLRLAAATAPPAGVPDQRRDDAAQPMSRRAIAWFGSES